MFCCQIILYFRWLAVVSITFTLVDQYYSFLSVSSVSLTSYTVTTVTCCIIAMIITCLTMTGCLFETIVIALIDKEWW